jgi:hypothetical protein
VLEEGLFLDWETVWEHGRSIGVSEEQARSDYPNMIDHRLTYRGKTAYIGASHFQFMTRRDLLKSVIPFPSEQPMRGERALDIAFDEIKSLRLNTEKALVMHMGNRLPDSVQITMPVLKKTSMLRQLLWLPGIRHFLLWLNNQIFRLYFFNVK